MVLMSLFYLLLRLALRLITGGGQSDRARDVEIVVLRHQFQVLKRQAGRSRLRLTDRVLLAAASQALPKRTWSSFFVTPQTLCAGAASSSAASGAATVRGSAAAGRPCLIDVFLPRPHPGPRSPSHRPLKLQSPNR